MVSYSQEDLKLIHIVHSQYQKFGQVIQRTVLGQLASKVIIDMSRTIIDLELVLPFIYLKAISEGESLTTYLETASNGHLANSKCSLWVGLESPNATDSEHQVYSVPKTSATLGSYFVFYQQLIDLPQRQLINNLLADKHHNVGLCGELEETSSPPST